MKKSKEVAKYKASASNDKEKAHCFVATTLMTRPTPMGQGNHRPKGSGSGSETGRKKNLQLCLACNIEGATNLEACTHAMGSCTIWKGLSVIERLR